jgi:hypothetical protein
MLKFTVACVGSGGSAGSSNVYIGKPQAGKHPLQHQNAWLQSAYNMNIAKDAMDWFATLQKIAEERGIEFYQLAYGAWMQTDNARGGDLANKASVRNVKSGKARKG